MKKRVLAAALAVALSLGVFQCAVFAADDPMLALQEETTEGTADQTTEETTTEPATETAEETPVYKTGVYKVDGVFTYYENGKFKAATGVAKRMSDGAQVYVEKGIFKKVTGAVKRLSDNKILYVEKGVFKKSTGIVKRLSDKKFIYVKNGVFKKATGVAKRISDKKWLYVKKGVFKKSTGVAKKISGSKWVYVKKGIYKKYTGLAKRLTDKEYVYVSKGVYTNSTKKMVLTKKDRKAGLTEQFVQVYAKALFASITNSKMTKAQKLKACFYHVADSRKYKWISKRIPYYHGYDWPIVYANDMIQDKGSSCFGFSSLFGYLAKLCGYKNVYWCCQGYHAWVDIDGRIYDPIFLEVSQYKRLVFNATYAEARAMNIGTNFDNSQYKTKKWMRIKVPKY